MIVLLSLQCRVFIYFIYFFINIVNDFNIFRCDQVNCPCDATSQAPMGILLSCAYYSLAWHNRKPPLRMALIQCKYIRYPHHDSPESSSHSPIHPNAGLIDHLDSFRPSQAVHQLQQRFILPLRLDHDVDGRGG